MTEVQIFSSGSSTLWSVAIGITDSEAGHCRGAEHRRRRRKRVAKPVPRKVEYSEVFLTVDVDPLEDFFVTIRTAAERDSPGA